MTIIQEVKENNLKLKKYLNGEAKTILILGVSGVGKSTLINHFIPDATQTYNKGKSNDNYQVDRTTTDISINEYTHEGDKFILVDSPGIFERLLDSYEKSCMHLENLLRKVKYVDYVWLCIGATKHGVRMIDLEAKKVLDNFPQLKTKTTIVITKCDLLDADSMDKFMIDFWKNFKGYTVFTKGKPKMVQYNDVIVERNITDTSCKFNIADARDKLGYSCKSTIFDNVMEMSKTTNNEAQTIDNKLVVPLIDIVQKVMIDKGYYSEKYFTYSVSTDRDDPDSLKLKRYIGIGALICLLGTLIIPFLIVIFAVLALAYIGFDMDKNNHKKDSLECHKREIIQYKKYIDKQMTLELYHLPNVKTTLAIVEDEIYYASGKLFYSGTLYGNRFGCGKFYYEDGGLMYEKLN